MSTRSHHQLLLNFDRTALSIYTKAVAWYECDLSDNTAPDLVELHPVTGYNLTNGGASANTLFHQPTLRTNGVFSTQYNTGCTAQYSPFGHYIIEIFGATDHAVIAWYKPQVPAVTGVIVGQSGGGAYGTSDNSNAQFAFFISAGKPSAWWQYTAAGTVEASDSTLTLTVGTSYLIGYSKFAATKTVDHYTNGAFQNTASYVNEPSGDGSKQWLSIGQVAFLNTLAPQGATQGIGVFKAALTAAEHAYIYNSGKGRSWAEIKTAAGH